MIRPTPTRRFFPGQTTPPPDDHAMDDLRARMDSCWNAMTPGDRKLTPEDRERDANLSAIRAACRRHFLRALASRGGTWTDPNGVRFQLDPTGHPAAWGFWRIDPAWPRAMAPGQHQLWNAIERCRHLRGSSGDPAA